MPKKGKKNMKVILLKKINSLGNIDDIKEVIKTPIKLGKIEIKNIAFGLKGLNVTVLVPDNKGGLDPVVEIISNIKNVDSVEVTDVGRI